MGEYEKKELGTLGTINAVLTLLLGDQRNCVFQYSTSQVFYADDGVGKIGPRIELAVQVISLLCGVEYKARRFVEAENSDAKLCSASFTFYVASEGELMGFNECPEDAFDNETDRVYRLVSCYDVMLMHAERGKRLDEVLRMYPEVNDPNIEDGYRVKAEVTIGWLRCVNVIAGLLQQELRVRNPEFRGMFLRR